MEKALTDLSTSDYSRGKGRAIEFVRLSMAEFNKTEEELVDYLIEDARKLLEKGQIFEIRKSLPRLLPDSLYRDYGLGWYTNSEIQRKGVTYFGTRKKASEATYIPEEGYYLVAVLEV